MKYYPDGPGWLPFGPLFLPCLGVGIFVFWANFSATYSSASVSSVVTSWTGVADVSCFFFLFEALLGATVNKTK